MVSAWIVVLACALTAVPLQDTSKQWQYATILEVKEHRGLLPPEAKNSSGDGKSSATGYDISFQVNDTVYVGFYTPPPGVYGFQYTQGMDRLVLVQGNTITLNDIVGRTATLPIIERRPAA